MKEDLQSSHEDYDCILTARQRDANEEASVKTRADDSELKDHFPSTE
jgi:hypothetical protein